MKHSHSAGWEPEEIQAFADSFCNGADALPKTIGQAANESRAWMTYESIRPLTKAELNYTLDNGPWKDRKWQTKDATIERGQKIEALLPHGVTAYFFNLTDNRNLLVSSELLPLPAEQH